MGLGTADRITPGLVLASSPFAAGARLPHEAVLRPAFCGRPDLGANGAANDVALDDAGLDFQALDSAVEFVHRLGRARVVLLEQCLAALAGGP